MIFSELYLKPVLDNTPRLLGLLNRNASSSSYGSFDREYWHYNTADFSCARKQEAVLTLALLYTIDHDKNRYYKSGEIFDYIRAALRFWTVIQNGNGSFNEWYPNENSFVVTSFSTYAVSESLILIRDELPLDEYEAVIGALVKAGDWLVGRNETRVMNQQTGAAIALYNLYLLTGSAVYRDSSGEKISLLDRRQSEEGWFLEYGGPDIGYLSLAIDYLSKYYRKTGDATVRAILERALEFIKYFIQPNLIAGGEYTSRNTEYLIPHGFELLSKTNEAAFFLASVVRKSLRGPGSFPTLFDDRYLTYVGYTWLQAYQDANSELDEKAEESIKGHFEKPFRRHYKESGLLVINDEGKHLVINTRKGGSFRIFDKRSGRAYSDSGILVRSENKWFTSGWLADFHGEVSENSVTVSGNMWKVPDKTLTPASNILLRLFQSTIGRSTSVSLWIKERLRDLLITKTKPSGMKYNRSIHFNGGKVELMKIRDSVRAEKPSISSFFVFAKDTHIYVPSSRYYVDMKGAPFRKIFSDPVDRVKVEWRINKGEDAVFDPK